MSAILKQTHAMKVEDLTKLSFEDLNRIKNKNLTFFLLLLVLELGVFYTSLFTENWISLFLSLGLFIASLSLYDNYKISKSLLEKQV